MSRDREFDLAIVGAGPAGLSAARAASELGLHTILFDMAARPGGHYYHAAGHRADMAGADLLTAVHANDIEWFGGTSVWGLYRDKTFILATDHTEGSQFWSARQVIIAGGAFDRPVPFPGWTLPGVITAGGIQMLLKHHRVLPGHRIVVAGTGPLIWSAAAHLAAARAQVVTLVELRTLREILSGLRFAPAIARQQQRLIEGWRYLSILRRARVPIRLGWTVRRAEGKDCVQRVIIGRRASLDQQSADSEISLDADTLCVGFGLLPETSLCGQIGCAYEWHQPQGCWIVSCDEWGETSIPGIYVAGDAAQVAGKEAACLAGTLSALRAAHRLSRLNEQELRVRARPWQDKLHFERRFSSALHAIFGLPYGLPELADDSTILCRCENVTVRDLRSAAAQGATCLQDIKAITRAGMGRCQGRMCQTNIAIFLARELARQPQEMGQFRSRPPAFPVPLAHLLGDRFITR